jgi:hypothetical protein
MYMRGTLKHSIRGIFRECVGIAHSAKGHYVDSQLEWVQCLSKLHISVQVKIHCKTELNATVTFEVVKRTLGEHRHNEEKLLFYDLSRTYSSLCPSTSFKAYWMVIE